MTSVTFNTDDIAEAVRKAAKIAPRLTSLTGHTAGLVLQICDASCGDPHVIIKATDGETYYMSSVDFEDMEGEYAEWRMMADRLLPIIEALPEGKTVMFSDKNDRMRIEIIRPGFRAWLQQLIGDSYPAWTSFDKDVLSEVHRFGEKIDMIRWAAHKDQVVMPWSGISIDGKRLVASDKYRLATVPCEINLDYPVVLPLAKVTPLFRDAKFVRAGCVRSSFGIAPDDFSQVYTQTFGQPYPNVDPIMQRIYDYGVTLDRKVIGPALRRAVVMSKKEKSHGMDMVLGDERMEFRIWAEDGGEGMEEVIQLEEQCMHEDVVIPMSADILLDGIMNGPTQGDYVMHYDAEPMRRKPRLYFQGVQGYECWLPQLFRKELR